MIRGRTNGRTSTMTMMTGPQRPLPGAMAPRQLYPTPMNIPLPFPMLDRWHPRAELPLTSLDPRPRLWLDLPCRNLVVLLQGRAWYLRVVPRTNQPSSRNHRHLRRPSSPHGHPYPLLTRHLPCQPMGTSSVEVLTIHHRKGVETTSLGRLLPMTLAGPPGGMVPLRVTGSSTTLTREDMNPYPIAVAR